MSSGRPGFCYAGRHVMKGRLRACRECRAETQARYRTSEKGKVVVKRHNNSASKRRADATFRKSHRQVYVLRTLIQRLERLVGKRKVPAMINKILGEALLQIPEEKAS